VDGERLLGMVYRNIPSSAFLFLCSSQVPSVPKGDLEGNGDWVLESPHLLRSRLHVPGLKAALSALAVVAKYQGNSK
jgi:hypothetical protein